MSTEAVAAIAIRRKRYIKAFRDAHATSREKAISLLEHNIRRGLIFDRLVEQRILVNVSDDKYFLDEGLERFYRRKRQQVAVGIIIVVALLILIGYLLVPKTVF